MVDNQVSNCYTKQAVAEHRQGNKLVINDRAEGFTRAKKPHEHIENYIVQETTNKPVILRQECRKALKLRNEITQ